MTSRQLKTFSLVIMFVTVFFQPSLQAVQAADLVQAAGKLTYLRVHALGSGYGPDDDKIDAEVIIRLDSQPERAFGFQLRDGNDDTSIREAMFGLLHDAFKTDRAVTVDYWIDPGKTNGLIHRVWMTK